MQNLQMYLVFTSLLRCSTHFTQSCRILPLSLPTTNNILTFVYSDITRQSAWRILFRPPWMFASLAIEGHQYRTHFDSGLLISRTFLPCARSSCTLLFCSCLVSCTQKVHWREHSLADTVPLFLTTLQFSSELSKNWVTGLPCQSPSWIYCIGQQHKASLLPNLFSCLSSTFLQLLHNGSYLSFVQVLSFHTCTITPFLQNADLPF